MQQKKFRKELGLFVVEGEKMVGELIASEFSIRNIYFSQEVNIDFDNLISEKISEKELGRLSSLKNPNKILAVAEIPSTTPINWNSNLILALDSIRDPGNLGTIIRTAKWFGVETIICSEDCADIYNPKVVQSTMGALFHVNIQYGNLIDMMKKATENGFRTLSATMKGESLYALPSAKKTMLFIGSESHGVSAEVIEKSAACVTIPNGEKEQKVESLNASVANALILSELTRNEN